MVSTSVKPKEAFLDRVLGWSIFIFMFLVFGIGLQSCWTINASVPLAPSGFPVRSGVDTHRLAIGIWRRQREEDDWRPTPHPSTSNRRGSNFCHGKCEVF